MEETLQNDGTKSELVLSRRVVVDEDIEYGIPREVGSYTHYSSEKLLGHNELGNQKLEYVLRSFKYQKDIHYAFPGADRLNWK